MYTDPIADYLTRVRNAVAANHKVVEIPASNLKKEITKILFDQGYILSYKFEDNAVQGSIKIALKYDKDTKESVIKISKELVNQVYVNIQVLRPFQESLMD
jgi:small subunit ribosomal protein S8